MCVHFNIKLCRLDRYCDDLQSKLHNCAKNAKLIPRIRFLAAIRKRSMKSSSSVKMKKSITKKLFGVLAFQNAITAPLANVYQMDHSSHTSRSKTRIVFQNSFLPFEDPHATTTSHVTMYQTGTAHISSITTMDSLNRICKWITSVSKTIL